MEPPTILSPMTPANSPLSSTTPQEAWRHPSTQLPDLRFFSPEDESLDVAGSDAALNILDNSTATFRQHRARAEAVVGPSPLELDEDDEMQYIRGIGVTITKTWLVIYTAIIRVLDVLVNVSLQYEKHALPFLRVFSILSLVFCCRGAGAL